MFSFVVILMLLAYFLWTRRNFYKAAFRMRGPLGLPLVGIGLNMMDPESFLHYMEHTSKQYKAPFISWMGVNCFLYVNDPDTVETIFNSPHCTNKGLFYRFLASAIGDGLFTSSSPRWNKHRRLINPAFSRQVLNNFLPIFNEEANVLLRILDKVANIDDHTGLEIYGIIKKSVLEIACQTTMGKKMNFQNDGSGLIFNAYNGLTEVCVKRMLSPWLYPDIVYSHSKLYRRQCQYVNTLYEFVQNLLRNTSEIGDEQVADSGKMSKKSIFVEQVRSNVNQGNFTWEDVRDEANVIIAATFETTSTALYFVCLCLAMHPHYQEQLYDELREALPSANDIITMDIIDKLSYTEMVINEAMRLFAPVPVVLRSASDDFKLKNGVTMPRGTQIGIDIFNMQRSESVWGQNAKLFRPEEHFGPEALFAPKSAFAYIPFTKGLRMCIGYRYAMMLMKLMIAKVFRSFRLHTSATMNDLIVKGTISLKLREYPLCQIERRLH